MYETMETLHNNSFMLPFHYPRFLSALPVAVVAAGGAFSFSFFVPFRATPVAAFAAAVIAFFAPVVAVFAFPTPPFFGAALVLMTVVPAEVLLASELRPPSFSWPL